MNGKEYFEECLRKLMVSYRPKIEQKKEVDMKEVSRLLKEVQNYGNETNDIRFLDCLEYFKEIGVSL